MENTFIPPPIQLQIGQFERYVRELCCAFVVAQLQEIMLTGQNKGAKFLTKQEAAALIGRSEKTIDIYRKKGLPVHMYGRTPMFLEAEVKSFIATYNNVNRKQ